MILSRRWPLHALTPSGAASPKTPSPVPTINGCSNSGVCSPHSAIARSSSPVFAHIHLRQLYRRPCHVGTTSAAFRMIGNDSLAQKESTSSAVRASWVLGTLNPASWALWICMHLLSARSALAPLGPASSHSFLNGTRLHSQTAMSSTGNSILGTLSEAMPKESINEIRSERDRCRSDSGGQIS